jgi:YD repeat-containing protein
MQSALGMKAEAQNANPCTTQVFCSAYSFSALCAPPLPAGAFGCVSSGNWSLACQVMNPNCTPEPVCQHCAINGPTSNASNPITLGTGNTFISEVDVKVPGIGGGLSLTRTWNSLWPGLAGGQQGGIFGPNWRSTFEERIYLGTDRYMKYMRGDGEIWSFGYTGPALEGTTWQPAGPFTESVGLKMAPLQSTLTFANGEVHTFDPSTGNLLSITDRNANVTQLAYDSSNRLATVTDPASRHLYFNYPNGSSFLVSSVTSDFGISLSYSYDTQGRLIQVTKPDQTTVNFTYNSQSFITSVTDSNGKVLESHTYDAGGRGLTGARAGGAEAVTVIYP